MPFNGLVSLILRISSSGRDWPIQTQCIYSLYHTGHSPQRTSLVRQSVWNDISNLHEWRRCPTICFVVLGRVRLVDTKNSAHKEEDIVTRAGLLFRRRIEGGCYSAGPLMPILKMSQGRTAKRGVSAGTGNRHMA